MKIIQGFNNLHFCFNLQLYTEHFRLELLTIPALFKVTSFQLIKTYFLSIGHESLPPRLQVNIYIKIDG